MVSNKRIYHDQKAHNPSIEWKPPKTSELTCDQWSLFEPSAESKAELLTEILSYCRKEKNNVYKMCSTKCIIV